MEDEHLELWVCTGTPSLLARALFHLWFCQDALEDHVCDKVIEQVHWNNYEMTLTKGLGAK